MGRDQVVETMTEITNAVLASLALAAKKGAVRIDMVEDLTKQISGPGYGESLTGGASLTGAGKLGISMAMLVLLSGVTVLIMYFRFDRRHAKKKRDIGRRECWDIMRYFDTGSLTATYQAETESDLSEKPGTPVNLMPPPPLPQYERRSKTRQDQRRDTSLRRAEAVRHGRMPENERPPVVVIFGPSFDPERDRYINAMDEESSCPPEYVFASADLYDPMYYAHDRHDRLEII